MMIGLAGVLEGGHETDALGNTRWPHRLRQVFDALSCDRFLCVVVAVLCNALELEASTIQPRRGADAAVPPDVVPRDADGDVFQRVADLKPAGRDFQGDSESSALILRAMTSPMSSISKKAIEACGCP